MFDKGKYIVFKHYGMIIFPLTTDHIEMKRLMKDEPISAGFITIGITTDNKAIAHCYGGSVTLKLESNPEKDSRLAEKLLGL